MNSFVNINGKLIASENAGLPHDNRAFRYGYGLFETMLINQGRIELARYHWDRLFKGLSQLHFNLPKRWSPDFFSKEVLKTVEKNTPGKLTRVRLQVWDGNGGLFEQNTQAQFIIECFPLDESIIQLNENGLILGIAQNIYKSNDSLAHLKSCNAMIYAVAARQVKENKWNDALIVNADSHIIESTIANIFWVKNGQIFTPPLSEGCVDGTMRRYLLDFLSSMQLPVTLKFLTVDELATADEVFLTNAIRKLKWVSSSGDKNYECRLISMINKELEKAFF